MKITNKISILLLVSGFSAGMNGAVQLIRQQAQAPTRLGGTAESERQGMKKALQALLLQVREIKDLVVKQVCPGKGAKAIPVPPPLPTKTSKRIPSPPPLPSTRKEAKKITPVKPRKVEKPKTPGSRIPTAKDLTVARGKLKNVGERKQGEVAPAQPTTQEGWQPPSEQEVKKAKAGLKPAGERQYKQLPKRKPSPREKLMEDIKKRRVG